MSTMKRDVKETIESSMSEEDLLSNIDKLNPPLTEEEMSNVVGALREDSEDGGPCKKGNRYY